MEEHREVKYVWTWPIRLTHWLTFLSFLVLTVTGYYIAFPPDFIHPQGEPFEHFFMANLRLAHFISAAVMVASYIVAVYLIFVFKAHALWKDVIPTAANLKRAWKSTLFYCGFAERQERYDYLDPISVFSIGTITILGLLMIFTGTYMYISPRALPGFWSGLLRLSSGWTAVLFGGLQGVRVVHHFCMWLIMAWFVVHVYFQVWKSIKLKQYDISAIVGGYKFIDVEE